MKRVLDVGSSNVAIDAPYRPEQPIRDWLLRMVRAQAGMVGEMNDEETLLTMNEYQDFALRTWQRHSDESANLGYLTLGLNGEAGEVAEHVKKRLRHGKDLDRDALKKELGDMLWYLAVMAYELGFRLEDVAADNIVKLRARYPAGFVQRWKP